MAALCNRSAMIVTVDSQDTVMEQGIVLVEHGRLAAVRLAEPSDAALPAAVVIEGAGMAAMPGLVNAHVDTEVSIVRGTWVEFQ